MKFDNLEKFLNYGIFTIPEYQRGYSWSKEQLDDFVNDLSDVDHIKEHYAGTITLIKSGHEKIGINEMTKYDIVDGQQRLTTFHLFLLSIYHRIGEVNPLAVDDIIIRPVIYKGKTILRLNNKENQDFFFNLANEFDINIIKKFKPNTKTQKNLLNARLYFYNYLQRFTSEKTLVKNFNNLKSKFKVNIFELDEESEVGLIFETMNDRGLPLSDIDKVKNYLIYLSHKLGEKSLAKDINKKFGEVFSELMKIGAYSPTKVENQFLKHCYIVYAGDNKDLIDIPKKIKQNLIKHKEIFVKKNLFDNDGLQRSNKLKEIRDFSNYLHKSSINYSLICNHEFENNQIKTSLFRLEMLGKLENFIPLYLAILNNKTYKTEFILSISEILECFVVRTFIFGNKKGNTGNSTIFELSHKIFQEKMNFTELKKELKNLIIRNSNNLDLKKTINNINAYHSIPQNALKLILIDYEFYIQEKNKSNHDIGTLEDLCKNSKITIEHIAPQLTLPGSKQLENINLIGNLVISADNSALANKNFESKKNHYGNSDLSSEKELATIDYWDDKSIVERGKKLQKFIMEKWKI